MPTIEKYPKLTILKQEEKDIKYIMQVWSATSQAQVFASINQTPVAKYKADVSPEEMAWDLCDLATRYNYPVIQIITKRKYDLLYHVLIHHCAYESVVLIQG